MVPSPTVFKFVVNGNEIGIKRLHPLPRDKFIQVGAAGMGFVLMHRSVITRILAVEPNTPIFTEVGVNKSFMGEDIFFFALCNKAEIPVWCDTSALVPHMKRFSFDVNYYDAFVGDKRQ